MPTEARSPDPRSPAGRRKPRSLAPRGRGCGHRCVLRHVRRRPMRARFVARTPEKCRQTFPVGECFNTGLPLFWKNECVGYSLTSKVSAQVSLEDATAIAARAFSRWTGTSCSSDGTAGSRVSIDARDLGPVDCATNTYVAGPSQPARHLLRRRRVALRRLDEHTRKNVRHLQRRHGRNLRRRHGDQHARVPRHRHRSRFRRMATISRASSRTRPATSWASRIRTITKP